MSHQRKRTLRAQAAFLLDWAERDRKFGLAQCARDEAEFPGVTQIVQDHLDMVAEAARHGSNIHMICAERAALKARSARR